MNAREIMEALLNGWILEEPCLGYNDSQRLIRLRGDNLESTGCDGSWIEHSSFPPVNFDLVKVRGGRR